MELAFLYNGVYPFMKGGVEKRIFELGKRLSKNYDCDVTWYCMKLWEGKDEMVIDGIRMKAICFYKPFYKNRRRSITQAIFFGIFCSKLINEGFELIDVQNFPYFHCFTSKLTTLLKNQKFILTWHEYWGEYWLSYLGYPGYFGRFIEYLTTKLSGNNVAVSEFTKKKLEARGIKAKVIPNGIDWKVIQRVRKDREECDVIYVGRLIKEKQVDLLLKAVALLKKEGIKVKVKIIGDGYERRKLEKYAKENKLDVSFLGFLERQEEVYSELKSAKVFVLPSLREGFGISVLEALACKLPCLVINARENAAKYLIREGYNGFAVEDSPISMAEKIQLLLSDSELRKRLGKNALRFSKRYDWDEVAREYYNYCKSIA